MSEKSLSLYEITASMSRLHDLVSEDEGLTEFLDSVSLQLNEKVDNIVKFQRNLDLTVRSIDEELTRLQVLRDNVKAKQQRLLDYVKYSMEKHGIEKIDTGLFVLSFRQSTAVIVDDENLVPLEYKKTKTTVTIDKVKIGKQLKEGESIKGVHFETRRNLQVK